MIGLVLGVVGVWVALYFLYLAVGLTAILFDGFTEWVRSW